MRTALRVALVLAALLVGAALVLVRDGGRIIPQGEGKVELDVGEFEAFPLPDYAAAFIEDWLDRPGEFGDCNIKSINGIISCIK